MLTSQRLGHAQLHAYLLASAEIRTDYVQALHDLRFGLVTKEFVPAGKDISACKGFVPSSTKACPLCGEEETYVH